MPQPPILPERDSTDLHALRLILRDLVTLLLTERNLDATNRQTLVSHLDALDEMIGDDDYADEEP